jgi:hypothetical protein
MSVPHPLNFFFQTAMSRMIGNTYLGNHPQRLSTRVRFRKQTHVHACQIKMSNMKLNMPPSSLI